MAKSKVEKFFPYPDLRPYQLEASSFIYEVFLEGKIGLLNAPCGIGKSIAALAAYAALREEGVKARLLVFTRTKNQAEIYIRELRAMRNRLGVSIPAVVFKTKMEMCPKLEGGQRLAYQDFLRYCAGLKRRLHGVICEFYEATVVDGWRPTARAKAAVARLLREGASMPEEVYEKCRDLGLCPYEVSKFMSSHVEVLIGSYNYILLSPVRASILSRAKVKLKHAFAVFDEAHSLPRYVVDMLSDELSTRSLRRALAEAEEFKVSSDLVKVLEAFKVSIEEVGRGLLREVKADEERIVDRLDVASRAARKAGVEDPDRLIDLLGECEAEGERIRYLRASEGKLPISYLARSSSFLADWLTAPSDVYVAYVKLVEGVEGKYYRLGLKCLDPSKAFSYANRLRSYVLMSGTLWNTDYYVDVLGLDRRRVVSLSLPYPYPRGNRLILVDLSSTTKYERRGETLWVKVAERLSKLLSAIKGRVAVYAPSYEVLSEVTLRLKTGRPILVEREQTKVSDALKLLREHVDAAIFGVAGGKLSEGVDLTLAEGRGLLSAVVLVGLPYPKRSELHEAQVTYYKAKFGDKALEYAVEAPCIVALAQAAGRLIRGPEDRGAVVIMDYRAAKKSFKSKLPQDWREDLRAHRSLDKIIEDLASLRLTVDTL